MNNNNKSQDSQFLPRHTEYIRRMSEQTGRSYRDLEAEWKKATREFDFERMRDPLKYANLKKMDGTVAQEISRRFEEVVLRPVQAAEEEVEEQVDDIAQEEFGDQIEEDLIDDTMTEEMPEEDFADIDELIEEPVSEEGTEEESLNIEEEPLNVEEELEEENTEGVPNKSLEKQRQLERPTEETATTPEEVNEKES